MKTRDEILDEIESIFEICDKRNIGFNESELDKKETLADYLVKNLALSGVSNTEGKCCPHCGKCNMNYDYDGSYLNWECKTLP